MERDPKVPTRTFSLIEAWGRHYSYSENKQDSREETLEASNSYV